MDNLNTLVDEVYSVQADSIELPVLSNLVKRVQETSSEKLRCEDQMWTDGEWRQWRQASLKNTV